MRFISYKHENKASWGAIEGDSIFDLSGTAISLKSAIAKSSLPSSAADIPADVPELTIDDLALLPPIPNPTRIICVGQNYAAHRDEMGGATTARRRRCSRRRRCCRFLLWTDRPPR